MRGDLEDRVRRRARRARLRAFSFADWCLLVEAGLFVAGAMAAIAFLPFKHVGRLASRRAEGASPPLDPLFAVRIRWAVEAVARRMPLRAKCFECGLAAQWMLQRRGYAPTLFYGATMKGASPLAAHVWVRADQLDIVGCDNAPDFTVLACFPGARAQTSLPALMR